MPNIKIADFEGPFDLLLHLIKKHEMDIYNIEIYEITSQYLDYLNQMKTMDLEITSEFIVIAATLIEIKSKKLLPKVKIVEDVEEDIEKKLMDRLIEYKKIKNVSIFLKEKYIDSGELYTKKPEIIEEIKENIKSEDILKNITLIELYNIYNNLIESYSSKQNKETLIEKKIFLDKYKVEDKMEELFKDLSNNKVIKFQDIMKRNESKLESIVTFLALLELIKLKMVQAFQDNNFSEILIKRRNSSE